MPKKRKRVWTAEGGWGPSDKDKHKLCEAAEKGKKRDFATSAFHTH